MALHISTKNNKQMVCMVNKGRKATTGIKSKQHFNQEHRQNDTVAYENDSEETSKEISKKEKKLKSPKKQKKIHKLKERQNNECTSTERGTDNILQKDANKSGIKMKNIASIQKTLKPSKDKETFPKYIAAEEIERIRNDKDLINVEYVEGYLRINPRFYKHAYLSMPDEESDLMIIGLCDRNRALEGDLVLARVNPPEKRQPISEEQSQRTGTVVYIIEKVHPRKAIGTLKKHGPIILFHPRDQRVPLLRIYPESLPEQIIAQSNLYENTLFLAKILNWEKPQLAVGTVIEQVGTTGDIEAESHAILLEHNLDVTPYSKEAVEGLPGSDYLPTEDELKEREDWRHKCVFTIDPDVATDLDDAVSCKLLENGNYEIGVHISDVTHYLEFSSPLDMQVAKRATTVYMTDNVYHMLPKQLCQVCSLQPGQDKLAFSVIWEVQPDAEIVTHRFAKTIINSCCQMSYFQAQMFLEYPNVHWEDDFLNISGNFKTCDLANTVNILHKLAVQMRGKRFADGALRIDQPKLCVKIDKSTGLPMSYSIEVQKDSNRLIEEFMLLANMTVATHLYNTVPDTALLRNHSKPSKHVLNVTRDTLQKYGIHLDIESAGTLQASLTRYGMESAFKSVEIEAITKYRMMVINNLCAKAMARATYKCASTVKTEEELRHYALNAPLYTHFTSPIRRYADCVVHRLLYASIWNKPLPEDWSKIWCSKIAANCNVKKCNAKLAQDRSSELYFTYLVNLTGPFVTLGIVLDVKENSMDVILCQVGIKLRVYFAELEGVANVQYSAECSVPTISMSWKKHGITQVINIFTLLHLRVEKHPKLFRLVGVPLPPQRK